MKKKILKFLSKIIAKIYWGYLKDEIDQFELNVHRPHFRRIGKMVIFKGKGTIFHPENIIIEDFVQIGENYFMMGIGNITIGEGTLISRNVCLHSGNHDFTKLDELPFNKDYLKKSINIGKGVWIGQNVNILPGVQIGDGAIIGMGTTVSKDIGKGEIVVGCKQRVIGQRDTKKIELLVFERNYYGKNYNY